jgi:hypothetical protein
LVELHTSYLVELITSTSDGRGQSFLEQGSDERRCVTSVAEHDKGLLEYLPKSSISVQERLYVPWAQSALGDCSLLDHGPILELPGLLLGLLWAEPIEIPSGVDR